MTQQQFVQEFKSYPKAQKSVVVSQLLRILADDLEDAPQSLENGGEQLSIEEKTAIVESLAGSLKMENPPMTKEETREMYYEHLSEKYK